MRFLFLLLLFSLSFIASTIFAATPETYTRNARLVLEQGNITSYLNTLYTISEPLPDRTARIGAQARLEGCVRPQQFEAVANSIVFISSNKVGAQNVTDCLSYCTALRRLDYWMQSGVNYNNYDVPLYELSSGISSDSTTTATCWCLPQNMTTVADIILWSESILPSSSSSSSSQFNDIFLPPSCCGPQDNIILNKPGATFVDGNVSASSAPMTSCPASISSAERASLISIFTSKFSCGVTSSCGAASGGCVRHPVFKPPISFSSSFDSCVPVRYPPPENGNSDNDNTQMPVEDLGLNWDAGSYIVLVAASIFVVLVVIRMTMNYLHSKREKEARERLLAARGSYAGSTPHANVSSLLNNNNQIRCTKGKRNSIKRRGRNANANNINDDNSSDQNTINMDDVDEDLEARAEARAKERLLLSKLPTTALATRPMEVCRQMAALILNAAFKMKPSEKVLKDPSKPCSTTSDSDSSRCPICLEKSDSHASNSTKVDDQEAILLKKLPQQIMLPACGHIFHTACVHRHLVFKAQKMDEHNQEQQDLHQRYLDTATTRGSAAAAAAASTHHHQTTTNTFLFNPSCAVCGSEIISDVRILDQVEALALGKPPTTAASGGMRNHHNVVISSNPLQ